MKQSAMEFTIQTDGRPIRVLLEHTDEYPIVELFDDEADRYMIIPAENLDEFIEALTECRNRLNQK